MKRKKGKTASKKKKEDLQQKALLAAFQLIEEKGWAAFHLEEVAKKTKIPLQQVHEFFPEKTALLKELARRVDNKTLACGHIKDSASSVKEALFELIMERFDVLSSYRNGLKRICFEGWKEPFSFSFLGPLSCHSVDILLETTGMKREGILGVLKEKIFSLFYLYIFKIWLEDDSADMSKTMASLDAGLSKLEELNTFFEMS
jgi:AcrR family transcriptional regulator